MTANQPFTEIPYTPQCLARQAALDFLRETVSALLAGVNPNPAEGPQLLESAGRGADLIAHEPEYRAAMWLRCA